jgi:beta-1,4-mannooligosaccharide/beta-1,4-mannosyl-N-acetylglucosamine phosphorylase
MSKELRTVADSLPAIPWQPRPAGSSDVVWRYAHNPVIGRNPIACATGIYNSAVVPFAGRYVGVFRADHRSTMPFLHFGTSADGLTWDIQNKPIEFVTESGRKAPPLTYGYDPRLVKIEDTFYITWCNCYHGPTIGVARTTDFERFTQLENAFLPFNRNGVLFPRKINGNFVMLNRPSDNGHTPFGDIFVSESPDMCYWGKHRHVMAAGPLWWDGTKIGAGPIPLETSEGWLMLYHGVLNTCNGFVYSMGAAMLDLDDPSKVRYRTNQYLLTPEQDYETVGKVPNVVFPCATLVDGDTGRMVIYYGAADTATAIAFAYVDELVAFTRDHSDI